MSVYDCAPDCDERAECPEAGHAGHHSCGRCSDCGVPTHHHPPDGHPCPDLATLPLKSAERQFVMSDNTQAERDQLARSYNKLRVEMGYEPVDFNAPGQWVSPTEMEHGTWKPEEQASTKLGLYYAMVKGSDQLTEADFDAAMEASIEAVAAAGFDYADSDQLGIAMSEDVQTLLQLAFVRCPELMTIFGDGLGN